MLYNVCDSTPYPFLDRSDLFLTESRVDVVKKKETKCNLSDALSPEDMLLKR